MTDDSLIAQLSDLTPDDLQIIQTVNHMGGAATAEEVALKMDRPAEDLTPQMEQLVQKNLMTAQRLLIDDEEFEIYQLTSSPTTKNLLR